MAIYLYRKELTGGDAYVYANDALREKVPLSMTVPCTLEQLPSKLAEIIEDDRILFEIPFPLNTQMPYYNYLKQLFPNSYTQANVTQNIDGLHQKAGNQKVFELHGSIHRNYCERCGKFFPPEYIRDYPELVPKCGCGGRIKPDVVLYEEGLDNDVVTGAVHAISKADLMIVAGTSLTVYPAAGLVRYFRGKHLILINRDATPMDSECDLVIHDKVGQVLSSLK